MVSRSRIKLTQTQRLQLNTGLQASIGMLRTDAAGLTRFLEEHAAENPHLRLDLPPDPGPGEWLPRWTQAFASAGAAPDGADAIAQAEAAAPSLIAHVTTTIDGLFPKGTHRATAMLLAEALEPSGWLGRPTAAIAAEARRSVEDVETVLDRLQQSIEPTGLFARDLADCLRLQLREQELFDPAFEVILGNLPLVAAGEMARLAHLCGCPEAELRTRLRRLRALNPKPGAGFEATSAATLREPDLIARPLPDGPGWDVRLNRSSLPSLRLDPEGGGTADRERLAAARELVRLVEARNSTLLRVAQAILERQAPALAGGLAALRPLTMAQIAEVVDLHESTISRVVAGAAVDTPRGTWWLRNLFSRAVGGGGDNRGEGVAGAALKARLAGLIAAENPSRPLSDAALATLLAEGGGEVARRTVAKYRDQLNIPPAHGRKRVPPKVSRADRKSRTGE